MQQVEATDLPDDPPCTTGSAELSKSSADLSGVRNRSVDADVDDLPDAPPGGAVNAGEEDLPDDPPGTDMPDEPPGQP